MKSKPRLEPNTFFSSHVRLISRAVFKHDQATLISYLREIDSWDNLEAKGEAMWFLLSEILISTELKIFRVGNTDATYLEDVLRDRYYGIPNSRYSLQDLISSFESEGNAWTYLGIDEDSIVEFIEAWQKLPEPYCVQYNYDPSHVTLQYSPASTSIVRHCLTIANEDIVNALQTNPNFQVYLENLTPQEVTVKSREIFEDVAVIIEERINDEFFHDVINNAIAKILHKSTNISGSIILPEKEA